MKSVIIACVLGLLAFISSFISTPANACDETTVCLQKQITKNKNNIDLVNKDVSLLRSNTQKELDNAKAYSDKIERRALMNTTTITGVSERVTVNTNDIFALKTDQQRQDNNLTNEIAARIKGDERTDNAITDEVAARIQGDTVLENSLQNKVDTSIYNTAMDAQYTVNQSLSADIVTAQSTGNYANTRIDIANTNIKLNQQALANTNERVAQNTAAIASHEYQINKLQQQTNVNYTSLHNQIQDVKKRADAGTASVAAMANIPQVTESGRFSLGAGVGTHGSEQALAIGASSRLSQNVIGKLSVSADTQSKWTTGVGIAYQW